MLGMTRGAAVLRPSEMRAAEAAAIAAGTDAATLMERAGSAAALAIRRFSARRETLVLCGPGNNGGDGWVVARRMQAAGWPVRVAAQPPASPLCQAMAAQWSGPVASLADAPPAALVVDALLGLGATRSLDPEWGAALERTSAGGQVVALDCPSGIDLATGQALGSPVAAALTIVFGALKPGNVIGAGRRLAGRTIVADIGLAEPVSMTHVIAPPRLAGGEPGWHKFARGHALVVAGAAHHEGAARLAARAALRAGTGVVTLIEASPATAASLTDAVMTRDDAAGRALLHDRRTTAAVIGPGLTADARARDWLQALIPGPVPLVVDAGALDLFGELLRRDAPPALPPCILTPHDGEFARLFGPIGSDRLAAARRAAAAARAVVVLKGPETIVADPDGRAAVNLHAAPWLATAGSGDVLAGIIGALLAQGLGPFDAACVGAWLHGDCGHRGGAGLIADDLPDLLPSVLADL